MHSTETSQPPAFAVRQTTQQEDEKKSGASDGPSLDLVENNSSLPLLQGCEAWLKWSALRVQDGGDLEICALECKMFSCQRCGPKKQAWLKRQVERLVLEEGLDRFVTLTLKTTGLDQLQSFELIQQAWNRLTARIRRKYGGLEYVWIVETTERGYAHLHVLIDRYIPQRWLSGAWLAVTGTSKVVWITKVRGKQGARYVCKYVTKEAVARKIQGAMFKGLHVFGKSRGITFEPYQAPGVGWVVRPGNLEHWRLGLVSAGFWVSLSTCQRRLTVGAPRAPVPGRVTVDQWLAQRAVASPGLASRSRPFGRRHAVWVEQDWPAGLGHPQGATFGARPQP